MGEQEEELSRKTTIIQSIFTLKLDHQTFLQIVRSLPHDLAITTLEDGLSRNLDVTLTSVRSESGLRSEVDQLSSEVSLVLRGVLKSQGNLKVNHLFD
jgi:hypothetical protein